MPPAGGSSFARGDARQTSGIDIALRALTPSSPFVMADLEEALEESVIPYKVDLVDLAGAGAALQDEAAREGIP